jgi:aryl-alcohol dehydrogenase-like predicted oxidoreductase
MGVIPWSPLNGGFLSGKFRTGVEPQPSHRDRLRAARGAEESPGERIKRAVAEQLGDLADKFGITVVDMAIAFVLNHPAVTSAIIGPRTMEQLESQLGAPETELPVELLDAIDALVPPGVTLDAGDAGWEPPSLLPENRRR